LRDAAKHIVGSAVAVAAGHVIVTRVDGEGGHAARFSAEALSGRS
jgi:hypothetical protein